MSNQPALCMHGGKALPPGLLLQVVRWFWETLHHDLDEEGKRRYLFFVTGSDRVPIKGLGHLNPPHVISKWVLGQSTPVWAWLGSLSLGATYQYLL